MDEKSQATLAPNLGRHASDCKVCAHAQREEIEREFVNWRSPASIAKAYGLRHRASVYRHAHALGLFPKRQRNIRAALEKIIERAGEVEVNAAAVVSAVSSYARINSAGQWVERSEHVDLNQLFDKMSASELEEYARDGRLPERFNSTTGTATSSAMTNDQREVLFQSQKEDKAVELVEYAKTLYEQQDEALKRQFPLAKPLKEQAALKLEFANGSRIVGIPEGADQIRSFHPWGLLMDEAAFQPEAGEAYDAAVPVCQKIIVVSSAGPGWFADFVNDIV